MAKGMDWLAARLATVEKQVRSLSTQPQLGSSSIEAGTINEYDDDDQLVSRTGTQHDGTHGSQILSGPVPPVPSAPIVEPIISGLKVRWDGFFEGGETVPVPMDFARVEVHASTPPTFTLWDAAMIPETPSNPDGAVTVGVRFTPSTDGNITGVRFYKGAGNTGTHVAKLWTSTGVQLATATFAGETTEGWQQVNFAEPVPVTANTTYVASYFAPNGGYARDSGYFTSPHVNGPLTGLIGVFTYTAGGFPSTTYQSTNYWVDVVFTRPFAPDTADTLLNTIETPRGGEVALALPSVAHEVAFVTRALSGKASTSSVHTTATPLSFQQSVEDLGLGTKIYYGPDTPVDPVEGELWYHETAPGSGQHIVQRLLGGVWTTIDLDAVTDAVAQAVAAQQAADAAQGVADQALIDAATAQTSAESNIDYIQSRGIDLVTNGTGLLGDNTNFTSFTFDASDRPVGVSGSFDTAIGSQLLVNTELIPVDGVKKYLLRAQVKQKGTSTTALFYLGLLPYNIAGAQISPRYYMFHPGTLTTLAEDLDPGDTTVVLTNSTNWVDPTTVTHWRDLIFWDFTDSTGRLWPPETYSENLSAQDIWDSGAINRTTHTITLRAPYVGAAKPAGTPVSQNASGGSYIYAAASNAVIPPDWTTFSGSVGGIHTNPVVSAQTAFPQGTAYVRVLLLPNRQPSGVNDPASKMSLAGVSFSDAAEAARVAASKITSYYQTSQPAGTTYTVGDFWLDTDDNKLYRWDGTTWQAVQDAAIQAALTNAATAQAVADGKVRIFAQAAAPGGMVAGDIGDMWIDTDDANKIHTWDGDSWEPRQLGNNAIQPQSLIASNVIATGTISTALLQAGAVTADKIAAGTITAASGVIANAAIGTAQIADAAIGTAQVGSISASKIAAGTISATVLISGSIATSTSGARVTLTSTGLRAYNAAGTNTVHISSTGTAILSGKFQTDPDGNGIILESGNLHSDTAFGDSVMRMETNSTRQQWPGEIASDYKSTFQDHSLILCSPTSKPALGGFNGDISVIQMWSGNDTQPSTIYSYTDDFEVHTTAGGFGRIQAAEFDVVSAREAKTGFTTPTWSSLQAVRDAPTTLWKFTTDRRQRTHYGPVADDLPAELVRVEGGAKDTDRPTGKPGLTVDLTSLIGLCMGAIRELDAELDEYRRSQNRAVPTRKKA